MTDTTVIEPAEPVEPAVAAQPEPVIEPAPEPAPEPQPEPVVTEHGNKGKKPWFLERISQEAQDRQRAEERAAAAERRAQEAEARAALAQRGVTDNTPVPPPQVPPQDIEKLVDQRANERLFFQDTTAVKNAGLQKFGAQFENDLNILTAVGATNNDVVADILAVDKPNAHILLNKLAADPEKAAVIAKMDTRTRIAELTRMTMAQAEPAPVTAAPKPAPKQVSRAPAPPPPVDPGTVKVVDWRSDDASDADFSRGWQENMAKRANRR